MRVLVTGHRGYIGSVLVGVLKNHRFEVFGLDCDLYDGCDFGRVREEVPGFDTDLREIEYSDLLSFDAVVHLAGLPEGLPNDFGGGLIEEVNTTATLRLAECCRRAQVSRFIFASTCAVYGRGGGELLTEESMPLPTSAYSASKLQCERELVRLCGGGFIPGLMRLGTVYGVSPRLRLDLCVNDFVAAGVTSGRITPKTTGRAWRPVVHVEDIARAIATVLIAPDDAVCNQAFNVVDTRQNHRVLEIADLVSEALPHCTRAAPPPNSDERSYRVDGSKFLRCFPEFRFRWDLPQGIRQLRSAITASGMTPADFRGDRFRRVPRLLAMRGTDSLNPQFRKAVAV